MVMLPPDVSTIHIHNLPVQAAREQAVTAGDLALLQEFCKDRNCNPAATAPKQYFRVSCGTSVQRRNQSIYQSNNQSPTSARAGRFWFHVPPAGLRQPSQLPRHYVPISPLFHTEKTQCSESLLAQNLFHIYGNTSIPADLL